MTLAARTIAALRTEHQTLAGLAATLTDAQLTGPSGASDWTVAQVLSHLGSGAEITLAALRAGLGEAEQPGEDFNPSVWARWDSATPAEQRDGFLRHNSALVEALVVLTPEQHQAVRVDMGFLPAPISVTAFAGMRLSEVAMHSWDARVGIDPEAALLDVSTAALLEHLAGDLGFLLGFIGKPEGVDQRVVLGFGEGPPIVVDGSVSVGTASEAPTATFTGPTEAALRLIYGRLGPSYTPAGADVTGNATLEDLRKVFPGF